MEKFPNIGKRGQIQELKGQVLCTPISSLPSGRSDFWMLWGIEEFRVKNPLKSLTEPAKVTSNVTVIMHTASALKNDQMLMALKIY
jgi:hypothetical protein